MVKARLSCSTPCQDLDRQKINEAKVFKSPWIPTTFPCDRGSVCCLQMFCLRSSNLSGCLDGRRGGKGGVIISSQSNLPDKSVGFSLKILFFICGNTAIPLHRLKKKKGYLPMLRKHLEDVDQNSCLNILLYNYTQWLCINRWGVL